MVLRIIFSLVLLTSILFLPFWLTVILTVLGIMYFSQYWEAVALLFFSDLMFGAREERFFYITFVSLIFGVAAVVLLELLKKKLKFYQVNK